MSLAPPDDHKVGRDASASVVSNNGSPSGSPVSSPRSRPKPGLFHSLKQKIFTGQHTSDPEYDVGRQHFIQLHDALLRIQTQAKNYITHIRGLITSAHQVSDEFHIIFNGEGGVPHAYVGLIAGMNSGHDTLANDGTLNPFLEQINTTVMRRLTEELEHHRAIQARMADRDQVKADVDYYSTKVDKLRIDREKRASAGKAESKSDTDKFNRNQQKLSTVQTDYKDLNYQLIAELHRMWNERQHTLGPIVTDFLAIERQFVSLYSNAIQNIPGPDPTYFDFPRATTPAPPLPERTHPKHARAQSLGQQISTKTNTVSSTARRAKSTFTSPKHQIAILPTHVEKPISTAPSTAFTSSTTSTSTANTSIPLISPPPPSSSSSAPNSPHSRTRKTKRNASVSSNSKSISSITSPSGRVRLAITPRGEPKQIMHPLHTASSSSSSHPTAPTPVTIPQTTSTTVTIPQTTSTPVTPQSTLAAPHPWPTESSQSHTPASHSSIAPSTPEPFFSHFHPPEPTPLNAPTTNDPTQPTHQITPFDDPS